MADKCINCNGFFVKRTGGYYRYSTERTVVSSGLTARHHLSELIGSTISPDKRASKFLCPDCWNRLNETVRYKSSMEALFNSTAEFSYIGLLREEANTSNIIEPSELSSTGQKWDSEAANNIDEPSELSSTGQKRDSEAANIDSPSNSSKKRPLKRRFQTAKTQKTKWDAIAKSQKTGKWDSIVTAIRARQYRRAISGIYKATPGSRIQFAEVVERLVRKEVSELIKLDDFILNRKLNVNTLSEFSWEKTIDEATSSAPILLSCLKGAVTSKANSTSLLSYKQSLIPRLGTLLALILAARNRLKCKFFTNMLSLQFWRGGLKQKAINLLSKLGLCFAHEGILNAVSRIRKDFEAAALKCMTDQHNAIHDSAIDPPVPDEDVNLPAGQSTSTFTIDDETFQKEIDESLKVLYSDGPPPSPISIRSSASETSSPDVDFDDLEESTEAFSSDNEVPSSDNEMLSSDNEAPSSDNEAPSSDIEDIEDLDDQY